MKTALITTTISVPTVLQLYRELDPSVRFFVALDTRTPGAASEFCTALGNTHVCVTGTSDWACSDLIGWNTIARRNIALLEALKWGAEIIISVDDDNIPINRQYFFYMEHALSNDFSGLKARRPFSGSWFNPAALAFPKVVQRGFPQHIFSSRAPTFQPVTNVKIGVAQGMILGDPDTSAIDRISQHPEVHQVSELLRAGIVTNPREEWYAPLNSQNIAFVRALAPAFLMLPSYGRYDDIYAGLVAQRVMREHGYFVHYGQPFAWQQRNSHDLLKDLRAEQWGAEHILEFASWLDGFLGQHDVIGMLRVMATNLPKFIPSGTQELWLAWLDDCAKVMK
jgi:hypothetical protein